jgi:hypothetical protein
LRLLPHEDGGLAELGEEVVVHGPVFVQVEVDQSESRFVDRFLETILWIKIGRYTLTNLNQG